jgi:mannose-6-phosphate isomerase-like protein (cupin superfamily)
MAIFAREKEVVPPGKGGTLIGPAHGAVKGYCLGISLCDREEYNAPGVHADQEGFYVLQGRGMARVGDEEFEIGPGTAFLVAKGVPHTVRKFAGSPPLKLLWSHGAV